MTIRHHVYSFDASAFRESLARSAGESRDQLLRRAGRLTSRAVGHVAAALAMLRFEDEWLNPQEYQRESELLCRLILLCGHIEDEFENLTPGGQHLYADVLTQLPELGFPKQEARSLVFGDSLAGLLADEDSAAAVALLSGLGCGWLSGERISQLITELSGLPSNGCIPVQHCQGILLAARRADRDLLLIMEQ